MPTTYQKEFKTLAQNVPTRIPRTGTNVPTGVPRNCKMYQKGIQNTGTKCTIRNSSQHRYKMYQQEFLNTDNSKKRKEEEKHPRNSSQRTIPRKAGKKRGDTYSSF